MGDEVACGENGDVEIVGLIRVVGADGAGAKEL